MSVDSSVWTSGRCVDTTATRSCTIGDVAAEEEPEAAEILLALGELGEARGGRERLEGPGDDPPAGGDEILVVEIEEPRVVVGAERPPLRPGVGAARRTPGRAPRPRAPWPGARRTPSGRGRRARTRSRGAARPGPRKTTWSPIPCDAVDFGSSTPLDGRCDAYGEPREQLPVRRDEGLGLEDVGLGVEERRALRGGAREVGRRGSLAGSGPSSGGAACRRPRPVAPDPTARSGAVRADGRSSAASARRR